MPKRRAPLSPESVFARANLEQWLVDELSVLPAHRRRIWKRATSITSSSTSASSSSSVAKFRIQAVPDLPQSIYDKFDSRFVLTTTRVVHEQSSAHGAKLVIQTQDGHYVETVLIHHPESGKKGRTTVCVSSQIGCRMACTFCATGTLGLAGHLMASEILEQVHHARQRYPETSRVVFMAHGEPLDNYENVVEAIQCMPEAFGIPLSRITLSTVGVTHGIRRLARECPEIQLALSLHAPNDEIRSQIVPTTRSFSVAKIMEAVEEYQGRSSQQRKVMIEYILIDGVNASPECAHQLGQLLQGRNCMVNLIPYNPTDAGDRYGYRSPSVTAIAAFQDIVFGYHSHDPSKPIRCTVRWSTAKGQDIDAACGQLVLKNFTQTCRSPNAAEKRSKGHIASSNDDTSDIEDLAGTIRVRQRSAVIKSRISNSKYGMAKFDRNWYIFYGAGIALAGSAFIYFRPRKS